MKHRLFLLLFTLCAALPLMAQFTPQGFNYQSVVRDNQTGLPLTSKTLTLLFTVRSGASNGQTAYSEKHTASTNEYGLVNLIVGQGTPLFGTFDGINWGGGAKYLNVSVQDPNDPTVFNELGSSQLMSVPYALYAKESANGGGGGSDNWGNQTAFVGPTLTGNGTASSPLNIAQQNAQNGQVLKWDGTSWAPANDADTNGGGTLTQINTGTGLAGGPITTSGTIALTNTGVAPGAYGSKTKIPSLTIDAQGRIVSATNETIESGTNVLAGNGISVQNNNPTFTITNTGDTNGADDLLQNTNFSGDVTGFFFDLQIRPGTVGTTEILDNSVGTGDIEDAAVGTQDLANNAVTTAKISNQAVTGAKIDDMGATNGQVLKWNGTIWAPAADAGGSTLNLTAGSGIAITGVSPNLTITNSGDTNAADDLTTTSTANGDVSGVFSNLQLKSDVVTTSELADNAVETANVANQAITGAKIDKMSATTGQVLKWNGTIWAPAADNAGGNIQVLPGTGIDVSQSGNNFIVFNAGDTDPFDDITNTSVANGDVSGPFSNLQLKPLVVTSTELANNAVTTTNIINGAVTGVKLNNMGAGVGQTLKWNGTTWAPADDNSGGGGLNLSAGAGIAITGTSPNLTITNSGDTNAADDLTTASTANGDVTGVFSNLQLKADVVTTTELSNNAVETANLANNAVTGAKIDDMGATNGQVLRWNGTTWAPGTVSGVGDNWGTQTVLTNATLAGTGISGSPLGIAQQGAFSGQILKWNGAGWAPANDEVGTGGGTNNNYAAGTGISITGTSPNFVINNTGDSDNNPNNEVQTISLSGNQLSLSLGGGTVTLPSTGGGTTYTAGTGISFSGTAPNVTINNVGDLSNTNEIQVLNLAGSNLSLSNGGGSVTLPTANNYTAGTGISISGSAPNFTIINTGDNDKDPANELQNLNLTGPVLTISGTNSSVNFSSLLSGGGGFWQLNTNNISNTNSGSVVVGSSGSPATTTAKFQVLGSGTGEAARFSQSGGSDPGVLVEHSGTGPAAVFTAAAGPALVTKEGLVGIHTQSPVQQLDVNGDGRFRSNSASPQLTIEHTELGFAKMFMKNNTLTGGWNVVGKAGGGAEFGIEFLKGPGQSFRAFTAKPDTGVVIGFPLATSSVKALTGDNGFILENQNNKHAWEFWVTNGIGPLGGNLALYNDQLGFGVPAGTFAINGLYTPSDSRLKKDIKDLPSNVLDKMMQLRPVSYHYKAENESAASSLGFLAQDVKAVFPELVGENATRDGKGSYLSLNYAGFGVLAVKAVQEQQSEIEKLQREKKNLQQQVESLETRLKRLEDLAAPKK